MFPQMCSQSDRLPTIETPPVFPNSLWTPTISSWGLVSPTHLPNQPITPLSSLLISSVLIPTSCPYLIGHTIGGSFLGSSEPFPQSSPLPLDDALASLPTSAKTKQFFLGELFYPSVDPNFFTSALVMYMRRSCGGSTDTANNLLESPRPKTLAILPAFFARHCLSKVPSGRQNQQSSCATFLAVVAPFFHQVHSRATCLAHRSTRQTETLVSSNSFQSSSSLPCARQGPHGTCR